jgi:competence protein ComEA
MKRLRPRAITGCFILCSLFLATAPACVKMARRPAPERSQVHKPQPDSPRRVSLNGATREEFERLPGIGPALAARIVEHRERHGPFRRVEHLLLVRGFGERRFRQIEPFITAE